MLIPYIIFLLNFEIGGIIKFILFFINSISIGFLNGLFGSGGGILAVKHLQTLKIESKNAHASSGVIMFPLVILSFFIYLFNNKILIYDSLFYMLFALPGCFVGSKILYKIDSFILNKIFSIFILYSGFRMLF